MSDALKQISLTDIDIHDIGNTIQMVGVVWAGNEVCFITPGPNSIEEFSNITLMKLSVDDWVKFIRQCDLLETEIIGKDGITKIIYRKSLRQIDTVMAWHVFQRDKYTCRYCGRTGLPLTVDHVDLWENGGATVPENLITSCKKCNKDRGRMSFIDWLDSVIYKERSKGLSFDTQALNRQVGEDMPYLESLRRTHTKSR